MFNPSSLYPLLYDRRPTDPRRDWERWQSKTQSAAFTLDREHYNDLLREAEMFRLASRLPQRPSLVRQAWSRAQDLLDELTCRVRSRAFRQSCPAPAA